MDSQQMKAIANFLISNIENEMPVTLRVMEAVPADRMGYQPDSRSKTGLGLVRHLALEDAWMLNSIADGKFTPPPDDSDACGIMSPADGIARYKQNVSAALARIRSMSAEQLSQQVDLLGMVQMPAVNFLALMLKHSVHHRGQLSSYLRAMGSKVPEIYGPSADSQFELPKASAAQTSAAD